jgi:starch phosphorylase
MQEAVGKENIFIFGLTADEVEKLWLEGYRSANYYTTNERLARIVNYLSTGFAGESFADIASYLLGGQGIADPYMCLADFESYRLTHERMIEAYQDKDLWNRMSLLNIAAAGHFAADRSIEEYAQRIWNLKKIK